jgi:RNA polymerase sigma-70 factor (ECF subfamily)
MHRTADAFISLLQPHYNSALQYCRALYRNHKDAEDGLQDALIDSMRHFKTLRDESKFKSWFFTIITRTFYRSKRREANNQKLLVALKEGHHAFPEVYNDDDLGGREKILLAALDTLNEKEKTAVLLFEIGGLSLEEIRKAQMEKSISAIKSRLSRTRLKLRNTISEMERLNNEKGGKYDIKSCRGGE